MIRLAPIAALLCAVVATPAPAQRVVVRSGVNQEIVSKAFDPGDQKIILENIMRTAVFGELDHDTRLYRDGEALLEGLERDEFDIFAMTTVPYLENAHRPIAPSLAMQRGGTKTDRYLLLANAEAGGTAIADFEASDLILLDNGITDMLTMWLDVVLGREGLPPADEFFGVIEKVEKPNEAAIPVYFAQKPLCVISRQNWEMLAKLNPKMSERLVPVAESPDFLPGVLAFRKGMDADVRRRCEASLMRFHETPEGEQILRFGKIEKLLPVLEEDLATAFALRDEHRELFGSDAVAGGAEEPE